MKRTIKKKVRDLIVYYNWFTTGKSGFASDAITEIYKKNRQSALRALRSLKEAYMVDTGFPPEVIYRPSLAFCDWLEEHYEDGSKWSPNACI